MKTNLRKYLSLLALALSGGSIYFLPYIKYVFYDAQLSAMGINNQQSGLLITIYAVGCSILYLPGGILADKLSPKKSLIYSLLATAALSVVYAFTLSFTIAIFIWLLLSVSTIFVFWSSLLKAIRMIGTEKEQGRLYGIYYAGNGLTGAIVNAVAMWAFGFAKNDTVKGFFYVVIVGAAACVISALAVVLFIKDDKRMQTQLSVADKFHLKDVGVLLKNPTVWLLSIVILCAYGIFSSTSYFTPYLSDVMGVSATESGILTIFRNYVFLGFAPLGGFLADKIFKSTTKLFVICFLLLAALLGGVLLMPSTIDQIFIGIYSLLPGIFSMIVYGIVFSIISECRIPRIYTGTAIGIASIIGYLPDFFYSTLFGTWLDDMGSHGYFLIFGFLAVTCILGAALSYVIRRKTRQL